MSRREDRQNFIYLIRRQSDGALKLGITVNIWSRMGSHKASNGTVELLGWMRGDYDLENALLERFSHHAFPAKRHWQRREWFFPNAEMLEFARNEMLPPDSVARQMSLFNRNVARAKPQPHVIPPRNKDSSGKLLHRLEALIARKSADEQRDLTISDVSHESGVSRGTLYNLIEKKRLKRASSDTIERLCRYFKCDIGDIMYIEWSMEEQAA